MGLKIRIIGGSGSGKSYAAKELSETWQIPCYDLDQIFWDNQAERFGVKTPEYIRNALLETTVSKDAWIIEGVYYLWARNSFDRADLIFILCPNVYLQHWRAGWRFFKRKLYLEPSYKKETLKETIKLIRWNHRYNHKTLPKVLEFIQDYREKTFIVRSNAEIHRKLQEYFLHNDGISSLKTTNKGAAHVID